MANLTPTPTYYGQVRAHEPEDYATPPLFNEVYQLLLDQDAYLLARVQGLQDGSELDNGAITDPKLGSRTVDPSLVPSSNTGTLTNLLSWIANRLEAITGEVNWYDDPAVALDSVYSKSDTDGRYLQLATGGTVISPVTIDSRYGSQWQDSLNLNRGFRTQWDTAPDRFQFIPITDRTDPTSELFANTLGFNFSSQKWVFDVAPLVGSSAVWHAGNKRSDAQNDLRYLQGANNLSDLANKATARSNLGVLSSADVYTKTESDTRYLHLSGGTVTGPLTIDKLDAKGDIVISKPSAWLTIDSEGNGTATEQAAGLTIGEAAGAGGLAALQLTYKDDGTAYIGMGTASAASPIPSNWAMKFNYLNADVEFSNDITLGGLLNHTSVPSYDKLRVWSSDSHTIGLNAAQTFGYLDGYAMTHTVDGFGGWGFLWREYNDTSSQGAMSLTTGGQLYVKGIVDADTVLARNALQVGAGGSILTADSNTLAYNGQTIWHAGNDGAASGLNADTLDGAHGDAYARLAENAQITGQWTIDSYRFSWADDLNPHRIDVRWFEDRWFMVPLVNLVEDFGNEFSFDFGKMRWQFDTAPLVGADAVMVGANNLSDLTNTATARANLEVPRVAASKTFNPATGSVPAQGMTNRTLNLPGVQNGDVLIITAHSNVSDQHLIQATASVSPIEVVTLLFQNNYSVDATLDGTWTVMALRP